jgi:hypothetical protein
MEMSQSIKHTAQAVSTRITLHSATLRLVKVESGIKGLLPTSWAPPTSEVVRQVEEEAEFLFARVLT